jgi:hypothetical protein
VIGSLDRLPCSHAAAGGRALRAFLDRRVAASA